MGFGVSSSTHENDNVGMSERAQSLGFLYEVIIVGRWPQEVLKDFDDNHHIAELCKVDLADLASCKLFGESQIRPFETSAFVDLFEFLLADAQLLVFVLEFEFLLVELTLVSYGCKGSHSEQRQKNSETKTAENGKVDIGQFAEVV